MSKAYQRNLPVPFFSQRENVYDWAKISETGTETGVSIPMAAISCNITSLCMILHYFGITEDTPDKMMEKLHNYSGENKFRENIRAQNEDFVTIGANLKSLANIIYNIPDSNIEISSSKKINDLHDEIAKGFPVLFSYGPTWFNSSPFTAEQEGSQHIAVLRGFTEKDDVIINDPWGDVSDPYGLLGKEANTVRKANYYDIGDSTRYYGLGMGDNCVLREGELKKM